METHDMKRAEDVQKTDSPVADRKKECRWPMLFEPMQFFEPEIGALAADKGKEPEGVSGQHRMLVEPMQFFVPGTGAPEVDTRKDLGKEAEGASEQHSALVEPMQFFFSEQAACLVDAQEVQREGNATEAAPNVARFPDKQQYTNGNLAALVRHKRGTPLAAAGGTCNAYRLMQKTACATGVVVYNGSPYIFNGVYYEQRTVEELEGVILDVCRDEIESSGQCRSIQGACRLLLIDNERKVKESSLDTTRELLTFRNGVLDLTSGQMLSHTPQLFTTYALDARYLGASCQQQTPVFDQLLRQIAGGDQDLICRIWEIFGYCLAPDTRAKKGFLFQGIGDSGKSLLCNFLESFFPPERLCALSVHDLGKRFALAELESALLCISPDLPAAALKESAVGNIKALSGNDLVSGDRKYKSYAKFRFLGKLILVSNHPLRMKVPDPAMERRMVTVPFCYAVPERLQDRDLLQKLQMERDAVATKAIAAYFRLRQHGYIFSGNYPVNAAPALYECGGCEHPAAMVEKFLQCYFERAPDAGTFLADAYGRFVEQHGDYLPLNLFGQYFGESAARLLGAKKSRKRRGNMDNPTSYLEGIQMKTGGIYND